MPTSSLSSGEITLKYAELHYIVVSGCFSLRRRGLIFVISYRGQLNSSEARLLSHVMLKADSSSSPDILAPSKTFCIPGCSQVGYLHSLCAPVVGVRGCEREGDLAARRNGFEHVVPDTLGLDVDLS